MLTLISPLWCPTAQGCCCCCLLAQNLFISLVLSPSQGGRNLHSSDCSFTWVCKRVCGAAYCDLRAPRCVFLSVVEELIDFVLLSCVFFFHCQRWAVLLSTGIVPLRDGLPFCCTDILFWLLIDGAEWHAWVTRGFAKRSTNKSSPFARVHGCVSEMIDVWKCHCMSVCERILCAVIWPSPAIPSLGRPETLLDELWGTWKFGGCGHVHIYGN